jgi:hypothetical protein
MRRDIGIEYNVNVFTNDCDGKGGNFRDSLAQRCGALYAGKCCVETVIGNLVAPKSVCCNETCTAISGSTIDDSIHILEEVEADCDQYEQMMITAQGSDELHDCFGPPGFRTVRKL